MDTRLNYLSAVEYPVGASLCCAVTDRYCPICPFCQTVTPARAELGRWRVKSQSQPKLQSKNQGWGLLENRAGTYRLRSWTPARGWVTSILRKTSQSPGQGKATAQGQRREGDQCLETMSLSERGTVTRAGSPGVCASKGETKEDAEPEEIN